MVAWLEHAPIGTLVYAPGPRGATIPKARTERLLALRPMLHLNESEALALSGEDGLTDAMHALFARTGRPVIVTRGAKGADWIDGTGLHTAPGAPCSAVVDTIGAGDAHIGATLSGLCHGLTLGRALEMANRVSAAVVATSGAKLYDGALSAATEGYLR